MDFGKKKVAIVGTGFVGASIAYALVVRDIARELVLINRHPEKAIGEAKDIRHGIPGLGTANVYAGDFSDCVDCDLIILTVGRNRRPGESRLDLAEENVAMMQPIVEKIRQYYTRGAILIITNPVDIVTHKVSEWMGLPNGTVFGSGCTLDTSRFVRQIADYVGMSTGFVNGFIVGEHGDHQVPIWSKVTVGGMPIYDYCENVGLRWDQSIQDSIALKTRSMGAEIIGAKGKTHYGIATCVCSIANAVLNQIPTIASVCTLLEGEMGISGVTLSLPSIIGAGGVHMRLRERWTEEENRALLVAADNLRAALAQLG